MTLNISILKKDGLQLREALSEDVVAEYAEAMRNGAKFPPVTVFCDPKTQDYYLADGFHRVEAAQRAGRISVEAEQRIGDYWAAEAYACGANASAPRSAETKRRCVVRLWEHRNQHFGKNDPSEREIANLAHISRSYVHNIISALATSGQCVLPKTVTGKNGVTRARPMPPVRLVAPVRPLPNRVNDDAEQDTPPPPTRPVKKGYHIGPDGKQHAGGVALDQFGVEIPERIRTAFTSETLGEIVSTLQRARTMLAQAIRSKDPSVAAVAQRAGLEMENAYHELKAAKPYCVCRMCQGQGCDACRETGFQTEDQFKRNPPEFNP